ncbi:molybdopterin oxidoreductase family protein [Dermatobacter hominis]|uniref:molybdopterin oxidoreductase family protein n=1 Tax=Dermatobacter hominis TaxID=2884263 RepID=UPI001D11DF2D|nr:molybdopterin oxidoreductase family protein [Dermatobacter hominis]UDY36775.1 molybdopterin oxidoreductase family protein [Dermatobacter hominis]
MTTVEATGTGADGSHFRTCPLCEATCGLEVEVESGAVKRIRGDRDDVFSHGFICPKGSTLQRLHEDPDRLRAPLVRRDGVHVEVTWEEAFAEVDRRLAAVRQAHGPESVAIYLGNPNAHTLGGTVFTRPLLQSLGTRNVFSASTVDQMPRHVSSGLMYGNAGAMAVPDLDRTDYLLVLGADPHESNGSLCTAPDFPGRMAAISERGGRVVVVDPRRSRSAQSADEHVAIRPGTDALWLCALLHEVIERHGVDLGSCAELVEGMDAVRTLVAPFTADAVAERCGIDADTTRRIADELAGARTAAVYTRIGVHTVRFGTIGSWAGDVLTLVTGNLDRPGGLMWATPCHGRPAVPGATTVGRGFRTGRWASRVSGRPEVKGELPIAVLPEEITTPGEGRIRALFTIAGNPARSSPDSAAVERALDDLELMVSVDIYLNETTRHADVVLPVPSSLEKSHFDLAFYGLSVRNVANFSPPVFAAEGPAEHDVLARLALIASGQGPDADPEIVHGLIARSLVDAAVQLEGGPVHGRDPEELMAAVEHLPPPERMVDLMVRVGPYGDGFGADPDGLTLQRLLDAPHGVDLGPLEPRLREILRTPSGKVEVVPEGVAEDLGRLAATLDEPVDDLVLVGRRHLRSNNSWMHNIEVLVKGRPRCTLLVHPEDAARLELADGEPATVRSRVGQVEATVEVTEDIRPGVVSLPHGWGHDDPGTRMRVAGRHAGVNSNVLTDGSVLDPLSGNCALNAIPVEVSPVAAPLAAAAT